MSTWTVPITWTTGAVTAATGNVEWRDHLNFLKGALDILTASTTADTGNTTRIAIYRATTGLTAIESAVTGDSVTRFAIASDGTISWGPGGAAARDFSVQRVTYAGRTQLELTDPAAVNGGAIVATGYGFGTSTQAHIGVRLGGETSYRVRLTNSADGASNVGGVRFGDGTTEDVNLYRATADVLATDDAVRVNNVSGVVTIGNSNSVLRGFVNVSDAQPFFRVAAGGVIQIGVGGVTAPSQVVGARVTGYTNAFTGTLNRATAYATGTVTLVQLAERVGALQADLTAHGLIGA